ncbi:MAG TPA: heat-inducible transcriptional repressor HrcA [Syntrophorhabdaceae bacterium]|nr:heat-inducible transcriptional repressor HrcA [Syntrophorhabdaceae bacterium]
MAIFNEREKTVLELVLEHYIASAEPIGSGIIARTMKNKLSSATIRNIMGDLEVLGFLYKPHAVAGRIPTPKAFRYYVNALPRAGTPGRKELKALECLIRPGYARVEDIMEDASKVLASISSCTSIVVEPKIDMMLFKEVEFVKMSKRSILMVFVTSSGTIYKKMVETDEDLSLNILSEMKEYMNGMFTGVPFYALKNALLQDLKKDRETFRLLYDKIKDTLDTIIGEEEEREVYIEGTSQMIGVPEFSDIERLKEIFKALENKEKLFKLFDSCLRQEGLRVMIGNENEVREMWNTSIIMSTYKITESNRGILGVIGPMRMDYSRIIPLVDYTARMMTDILRVM